MEKGIVEAAIVQGGVSAILSVQAESEHGWLAVGVHRIISPEKSKPVKNLQRRVWLASACAPGKSGSCGEVSSVHQRFVGVTGCRHVGLFQYQC